MQPRYTVVIALKLEDYLKLEKLKKSGVKIVEVFRKGLEVLSK